MTQGLRIYRFKQIDSTNSAAFRYSDKGVSSGSVFVADYQTRGRGKWGRKWISPRGKNLLFSLLLHPRRKALESPLATQIACRGVARALEKAVGVVATFKRPNDVLVHGKKICGVLVEAKGRSSGAIESLVVGVGLNVNSQPEELVPGATSLWAETGRKHSREKLMRLLLKELWGDLEAWGK